MWSILLLLGISLGIVAKTAALYGFDTWVSQAFISWQPYWLLSTATFISSLDAFTFVIGFSVSLYLFKQRRVPAGIFVMLAAFSWIIPIMLKPLFAISCPATTTHLYCYPSGHVFDYVNLYGTLLFLAPPKPLRIIFILFICLIGFSRLSVGAHFFSQVVGGYLLGFGWLLLLKSRLLSKT